MSDLFHTTATGVAVMGVGLHLVLAGRIFTHREMFVPAGLLLGYAAVAAATLGASAVHQIQDTIHQQPFGADDLIALVPIIGFVIVGLIGAWQVGRHIGAVESKRRVDNVTANVTYLDVRNLA